MILVMSLAGITHFKHHMARAEELRRSGREIVSLGVGVPFFGMPREMQTYVVDQIENNRAADAYAPFPGIIPLRKKLSEKLTEDFGREVRFDEVLVTAGSTSALFYSFMSLLEEGDEVLVPSPYFLSYADQIGLAGGVLREVPMQIVEGDWEIDVDAMERVVNAKTKAIVVNSPHNPTGAVFCEESLRNVASFAVKHNLYVLVDDAYGALVFEGEKFSIASVPEVGDKIVVCGSFSKTFGMTGWRVGYLYAHGDLMKKISHFHDNDAVCAPHISQLAALYGLSHEIVELEENYRVLRENGDVMCQHLDSMKEFFSYTRPQGAFYIFVKYAWDIPSIDFSKKVLEDVGVVLVPGSLFGEAGEGYVRMSFGGLKEDIDRAFALLRNWIEKRS